MRLYQLTALLFAMPAAMADDCPVTLPVPGLLGEPFPQSDRWYGSEALAVMLPPNGVWRGMGRERDYGDKLFLWSYGYRPGKESGLTVSARRKDGKEGSASISKPTNARADDLGGWTMLVGVSFSSAGCWEVNLDYVGQKLDFVVLVADKAGVNSGVVQEERGEN